MLSISRIWVARIQPRLRPSPKISKRSRSGAQANFQVYGIITREKKPITLRSAPCFLRKAESRVMRT